MYRCGCHDPIVFGHLSCARWQTQPRALGRQRPVRHGARLTLHGSRPGLMVYGAACDEAAPPRPSVMPAR